MNFEDLLKNKPHKLFTPYKGDESDARKEIIKCLSEHQCKELDPVLVEKARKEQKELGEWLARTIGTGF